MPQQLTTQAGTAGLRSTSNNGRRQAKIQEQPASERKTPRPIRLPKWQQHQPAEPRRGPKAPSNLRRVSSTKRHAAVASTACWSSHVRKIEQHSRDSDRHVIVLQNATTGKHADACYDMCTAVVHLT
jgi:hypothetical protein